MSELLQWENDSVILSEAKKIKLNIGCGSEKIKGFINIDSDSNLNPDKVYDIRNELPFQDSTVDQIVMYHTLEHIPKVFWQTIFLDFSRVLKVDGKFWLSFPNYLTVMKYWISNHRGMREFWEACVFGRGLSEGDRHRSVTTPDEVKSFLTKSGFEIYLEGDDGEDHNSLLKCKNRKPILYTDVLKDVVWGSERNSERSEE